MRKMAIFQTDLNVGGIQKSCVNFLNSIDTSKYEVDLYLTHNINIFKDDINKDINIKHIKKLPYITRIIPFTLIKLFYKVNIRKEYDVAIDFNSYSNETAASAIGVKAKKRVIWIHNDIKIKRKEEIKYRIIHFLFKSKYKYFDEFVAVSTGALESFKSMEKLKNKEYKVIPNIINTKEIKEKLKSDVDIEIDDEKINICSVGRVVHQKGYDILISKLIEMKDNLDNYHFYIIGFGDEFDHISEMIVNNHLVDLVTLVGAKSNPYPIMNKMDAFILLSRYEGQGMVFLEAKALGLDIIMPEHLEKYVDGIAGTKNIELALLNVKKKKKVFNDLKEYNNSIINEINNL